MELQLLEQKIWILISVIGILWILLAGLFGLAMYFAKSFVNRIIERIDTLIQEIQNLKLSDNDLVNDVEKIKETQNKLDQDFKELKSKHESCKNYRKIPQ